MMLHATQVITIFAPVDAIWQVISDFGAGSKYLAMVTHCNVQGEGTGALRTLTFVDGSEIIERLEIVDKATHHLSYALLSDTTFGSCLTTISLLALSPGKSDLIWSADFQPTGLPADEAVSLMESLLAANCQALRQLFDP